MSQMAKSKSKVSGKKKLQVNEAVGNYEKHPFFIKKANAAKAFLKKTGLPRQLKSKTAG
jgi:hypothetical protein